MEKRTMFTGGCYKRQDAEAHHAHYIHPRKHRRQSVLYIDAREYRTPCLVEESLSNDEAFSLVMGARPNWGDNNRFLSGWIDESQLKPGDSILVITSAGVSVRNLQEGDL